MALVIPADLKLALKPTLNHLGGSFTEWMHRELETTLLNLADARDDALMRQLQGRARLLREILDCISAAQQ